MSNSVDQRIVEMVFDNAQFERGVSSTLASLKTLESGLQLQNGAKGLQEVQRAAESIRFDNATAQATGFGGALESLKNTASGVFSHITDAIGNMSTGIKVATGLLGSGLVGMMVSGAWSRASNINEATFKLTGMYEAMAKEGEDASAKVQLAMQNATDAVDGTAYSLDSAAMAAANLAASGVEAGDQLYGTLRSIAGIAAMSGRDYDSVAQIVSTIAGQGKLMTMQLRQFEMSGLNVAAVMAQAMDKTEEEIRDMVTAGDISFELFSEIMEEKFAGAAGKANETFSGSLANIRAALSRTLADFFQLGQQGMVPIFNGIRMAINGVNTALSPLLGKEGVLTLGAKDALTAIGETMKAWFGYEEVYNEATKKMDKKWFHQEELDHMKATVQGIADALKTPMDIMTQVMPNIVMTFIHFGAALGEVLRLFGELVGPVFSAFRNVFSDNFFGAVSGWIAGLAKHIYDLVSALHIGRAYTVLLEGAFTAIFGVVKAVAGVLGTALTVAVRVVSDAFFVLVKSIEIVLDVIGGVIDLIGMAVGFFADLFGWVVRMGESDSGFALIANTFQNIATAIGMIIDVISGKEGAFETLVEFISGLNPEAGAKLEAFGSALSFLGECFANSHELIRAGVESIADSVYKIFEPALPDLKLGLSKLGKGITDFIKTFSSGLSSLIPEKIRGIGEGIAGFVGAVTGLDGQGNLIERIQGFFSGLKENLGSGDWMSLAASKVQEFAKGFNEFAGSFKDHAVETAQNVLSSIQGTLERLNPILGPISERFSKFGEAVQTAFERFFAVLSSNGIVDAINVFGNWLDRAFRGLLGNVQDSLGKDLANVFNNLGPMIAGALSSAFTAVMDFVSSVPEKIASAFAGIGDALRSIGLDQVASVVETIGSGLSFVASVLSIVFQAVAGIAGVVSVAALSALAAAISAIYSALSSLAPYAESVKNSVVGFFQSIADVFSAAGFTAEPFVNFAERVRNAITSLVEGVASGKDLKSMFKLFGEKIKTSFDSLIHNIGPKVKGLFEGLWKAVSENLGSVVTNFITMVTEALANLPKLIGDALGSLDSLGVFDGLKSAGFEGPLNALMDFFSNIAPETIRGVGEAIGKFGEFIQPVMEHISGFKDGVLEAFSGAGFNAEPVKNFFSSIGGAFTDLFSSISEGTIDADGIRQFAGKILDAFKAAFEDIGPKIGKLFSGIWTALAENIGGPLGDFMKGLGDKLSIIPQILGSIAGAIDVFGIFEGLKNLDLSAPLESIKNFFSSFGDSDIGKGIQNFLGLGKDKAGLSGTKSFFDTVGDIVGDKSKYKRSLRDVWNSVMGGKDTAKEIEESGGLINFALSKFQTFIQDPVGSIVNALSEAVKSIGKGWSDFKKKIDTPSVKQMVDDIVDIVKKAAGLALAWQGIKALNAVATFFATFERLIVSMKGIAVNVNKLVKTARYWLMANIVVEIAVAMGLIVGAIAVLTHLIKSNDPDTMRWALGTVAVLLVALAAIPVVIGKVLKPDDVAEVMTAITLIQAIGLIIAELTAVTFILGSMDQNALVRGAGAIGALLVVIALVMAAAAMIDGSKLGNLQGTLIGLAVTLGVVAAAVYVIGGMNVGQLLQAGIALAAICVGLRILAKEMIKIGPELAGCVNGFITISLAIGILSVSLAVLGAACSVFGPGIVGGLVSLALIMAMLVVCIKVMSGVRPDRMIEISSTLLTFAAAVLIISAALAGLAVVARLVGDVAAFIGPLVALAAVILSLAVAVKIMSTAGPMATASAAALTALAFAVGVIAIAIGALALIPFEKIIGPFGLIILVIVALAGAFIAISAAATAGTVGLLLVIGVLLAFGASALMFGTAVSMIVESVSKLIETVSTVGPEFEAGLKRFCTALSNSKEEMAQGAEAIGYAVVRGLGSMISPIGEAMFGLLGEIGRRLVEGAGPALEAAGKFVITLMKGLAGFIRDHGGEIKDALLEIGGAIIDGIGGIFSDALTGFGDWLAEVTGVGVQHEDEARQVGADIGQAAVDGYSESMEGMKTSTDDKLAATKEALANSKFDLKEATEEAGSGISEGAENSAKGFDFLEKFGLGSEALTLDFDALGALLQEKGFSLEQFLSEGLSSGALQLPTNVELFDANGTFDFSALEGINLEGGLQSILAFGGGEEQGVASLTNIDALLEQGGHIDQAAISEQFTQAGANAAESFGTAFEESLVIDGTGPVEEAASKMEMVSKFKHSGDLNGRAAVDGLSSALKQYSKKAAEFAEKAVNEIKNKKSSGHSAAYSTGKAIGDGLVSGLSSCEASVVAICNRIIDKINEMLRKKAEVKSPSRMTMRIGRYIGEGLAVGLDQMRSEVGYSASGLVDAMESGFAFQESYLDGLLSDIEERPVIRPVLDLTDYNATLATMRGFDTAPMMLRAQMATGFARSDTSAGQSLAGTTNNVSIYLNYDASADANQIVMDIAQGLETRLAMEGV